MQQSIHFQNKAGGKGNSTELMLLGQRIPLKCSDSDPELVDETIELVSVLLRNSEMRSKSKVPHQVVLIALLELAEEYVKAKRRTLAFKQQMNEKSQRLLSLLEAEAK